MQSDVVGEGFGLPPLQKRKINPLPDLETLNAFIAYDHEAGIFAWKINKGGIKAGTFCNCFDKDGYRIITINQKIYKATRIAWKIMTKNEPDGIVDHIDRNRKNDIWNNLRLTAYGGNSKNKGMSKNNTSGYKGVSFDKKRQRWRALIQVDYENINLGYYDSAQEAAEAYRIGSAKYHGEFGCS